ERAARVDHRLAAIHVERSGDTGDGVVRDRDDDQLDLVHEGRRLGEGPAALDEARESLAPRRVPARHRLDRPAGPPEGDTERGPDGAPAADPADHLAPAPP